jgi:BspA type Leucine rich repeat region (6 copies)/Ig-like domain CHU_C associated
MKNALAALIAFFLPQLALAQTTTADGFEYTVSGSAVTITGYTGSGGAITIPAAISGVPVTAIGESAFSGDTTITGVIIPSSVTSIGSQAFYNCTKLASITVHASNPAYASDGKVLFNKTQTTLIQAAPAGVAGSYTIPPSVTSIRIYAFQSCTALTGVTIPSSVTSIGTFAFSYCTALTGVTIPSSVTSIGDQAFYNCTKLASITVDASNPAYASDGKVLFDKTQTTLIQAAPAGVSGSYTIPSSVTSIGSGAFSYCTALTGVTIPSSVTSIGTSAFQYCTALATLAFMGNAPTEESDTFVGTALTKINYLPTAKGWGATFSGITTQAVASTGTTADGFAYSLVGTSYTITGYTGTGGAVNLPATINGVPVTAIGDSAFGSKTTITGIVIPDSVITIGQSCFSGCANLASISLGAGVTDIASTAFIVLGKLTNISVASSNVAFSSSADGRALFNKSKSRIVKYTSGVAGSYSIPIGVTELGPYSFFYASGLTEIVIPNGVTWINDHVFTGCTSIASLTIPATVNRISCCQSFSSETLNKILFLGNKPTTGGSSSDFTGSGITAIHYAENATGWGATFAGYPTVAVKPTSITAPPASVSIVSSDRAELSIAATGAAPLTYQWYQGASGTTIAPISGATSATFLTAALTATTGYWVRITDAYGFFSYGPTATVTVSATSPLTVTHNVVGAGYQAGGGVIVTNIITYTGTAPVGITWDTLLPKGWTYLGSGGSEGSATKPTYKTGELLEWTWTTVPASPFEFTYTVSVPAGTTGDQVLVSLVTSQQSGTNNQTMAKPDPLVIRSASMHSADSYRDGRISLFELTRVIELYNYRSGTTRTGQYHIQSGTEDGFGTGP